MIKKLGDILAETDLGNCYKDKNIRTQPIFLDFLKIRNFCFEDRKIRKHLVEHLNTVNLRRTKTQEFPNL